MFRTDITQANNMPIKYLGFSSTAYITRVTAPGKRQYYHPGVIYKLRPGLTLSETIGLQIKLSVD